MGINITIRDEFGIEHDEWDYLRHCGDRLIPEFILNHPHSIIIPEYINRMYRPNNIDLFISLLKERSPEKIKRWTQLEILLNNSETKYWISW